MKEFKLFTLPNIITLLNLLAGFAAIITAASGNLKLAGMLIVLAGLMDFLDGLTARLTKSFSPIGAQLDSLSDLVSFGVAPAVIALQLIYQALHQGNYFQLPLVPADLLLLTAAVIPLFSALRLAKFNIDHRQTTDFIGLPTPANALFYASLPFIADSLPFFSLNAMPTASILTAINLLLAVLLILELPMFSLKFKTLKPGPNLLRYSFLLLAAAMLLYWGFGGFGPVVLLYILLSLLRKLFSKLHT